MKYTQSIQYLETIYNFDRLKKVSAQTKLKQARFFFDACGAHDAKLNIIHVAGTNGKGSTAKLIQEHLTNAGYTTGLYVSPHLQETIERISVDGIYISPHNFASIIGEIRTTIQRLFSNQQIHPVYKSILIATALSYFTKKKCDYAVIETGFGGRYDYTNILRNIRLSVITNVGDDHLTSLGSSLKKRAWHKAGIIKKSTPILTGANQKIVLSEIKKEATRQKAPLIVISTHNKGPISLNTILAQEAMHTLGIPIKKGRKTEKLPGRFEKMQSSPLVIIDAAHNVNKIEILLRELDIPANKKVFLILGLSENKPHNRIMKIIKDILPAHSEILCTRYKAYTLRAFNPHILEKSARTHFKKTKVFLDAEDALTYAKNQSSTNDLILITGSIYLAGELRSQWVPNKLILKQRSS